MAVDYMDQWDVNGDLYDIHDKGRGQPNGVATLDENGRIPYSQLPESAIELKGYWNAMTNTPTLADGTGTNGDEYIVSVAGSRNLGSGGQYFNVGDRILYTDGIWKNITSGFVRTINNIPPRSIGANVDLRMNWSAEPGYGKSNLSAMIDYSKLPTPIQAGVNLPEADNFKLRMIAENLGTHWEQLPLNIEPDLIFEVPAMLMWSHDASPTEGQPLNPAPYSPNVLVAHVPNGVRYSIDRGMTWSTNIPNPPREWRDSGGVPHYDNFFHDMHNARTLMSCILIGDLLIQSFIGGRTVATKGFNAETFTHPVTGIANITINKFIKLCDRYYAFGPSVYTSTDGLNWVQCTGAITGSSYLTFAPDYSKMVKGGSIYVFRTGEFGVLYSSDGIAWSASSAFTYRNTIHTLVWANNKFLVGTEAGVYYSTDGNTWTQGSTINDDVQAIAYNPDLNILVCSCDSGGLFWSTNGTSWTRCTGMTTSDSSSCVMYADGVFVATVRNKGIWYSFDGKTFTQAGGTVGIAIDSGNGYPLATTTMYHYKSIFICFSNNGLWTSKNGMYWTKRRTQTSAISFLRFFEDLIIGQQSSGSSRVTMVSRPKIEESVSSL